jgi:hypothetical protein
VITNLVQFFLDFIPNILEIATEKVCPSKTRKSKYFINFFDLLRWSDFIEFSFHASLAPFRMSSEFMTAQPQKGTVYRFIRVPELNQNTNTVVLIKNANQSETSTIAKVQKHVQHAAPAKIISTPTTENSGGKKVKSRVSLSWLEANSVEAFMRKKLRVHKVLAKPIELDIQTKKATQKTSSSPQPFHSSAMTTAASSTIKSSGLDVRKSTIGSWSWGK